MSLIDTLTRVTNTTLNRYQLDIPSCAPPLDVEDFCGTEMLSRLYRYDISFTSTDKNVEASQLLSKPATLTMGGGGLLALAEQKLACFHMRIEQAGQRQINTPHLIKINRIAQRAQPFHFFIGEGEGGVGAKACPLFRRKETVRRVTRRR